MKRMLSRAAAGIAVVIILITFLIAPQANHSLLTISQPFDEAEFYKELSECTTGLASGLATPDGRPLLWKNRDLGGGMAQEYHYWDDGRIPFISQAYADENRSLEHYGGVNAVGFAVENSNSYNFADYRAGNGDDDGFIMHLALATCRTVDDFQRILDSTNVEGRTLNSNYGTFDAFGGAAMFECSAHRYYRYDAVEAPDGFVIRANYSYSGHGLDARQYDWGPNRHDRSYELIKIAVDEGRLTPQYWYKEVIRNLAMAEMEEYTLPYDGYIQSYPYGFIPHGETVCRATTRAVMVAQGVRDGENPDDAVMWVMAGSMLGSVVTPLWVRAGSVPVDYSSASGSALCTRALNIKAWVEEGAGAANTWKLTNPNGTGFWDYALPLEEWVFDKTHRFLNSPNFNYDQLATFQNIIARQVLDSLKSWKPTYTLTEVSEPVFWENNIVFAWSDREENPYGGTEEPPDRFAVYRSNEPFRENNPGDLLDVVTTTRYVDENPPSGLSFYRVEAQYE